MNTQKDDNRMNKAILLGAAATAIIVFAFIGLMAMINLFRHLPA
jgi:hypothetical protein